MTLRGATLVLVSMLAGCSRPGPSPEYASAREKHAAVLAAHPEDAAARPEIEDVLRLLERVPADSPDGASARELRERILSERAALGEQASQRASAVEKAAQPPAWPSASEIGRPPPAAPPLKPGMKLDELAALSCFERQPGEFRLTLDGAKERPVESWVVKGEPECREKYAAYADQLVLAADGAVVAIRPAAEAKAVSKDVVVERKVERQVQLVRMPDGRWGMRGADGTVEPIPPGAEVRTVDGSPLPPEARP